MEGDGRRRRPAAEVVAEITAAGGARRGRHAATSPRGRGRAGAGRRGDRRASGASTSWSTTPGSCAGPGFPDVPTPTTSTRHLAVHVGGSFHVARAAWPHLVEQGYGRIVMTTSTGRARPARQHGLRHRQGRRDRHGPQPRHRRRASTASRPTASPPPPPPAWPARAARELPPELVAPMVAYLAHESCPVTGEVLTRRRRPLRPPVPRVDAGLRPRRRPRRPSRTSPSTGRRSSTRPATRCPPTSWPGPPSSSRTCRRRRRRPRADGVYQSVQ